MAKSLTVGNETFQYPETGTKPGWGEDATGWAVAVTNRLGLLTGPNDINCTSVVIANNQTSAADIGTGASSLSFPSAAVRSFVVTYNVVRGTAVEAGEMEGVFNGTIWTLSHEHTDCAGMCFQMCTCNNGRVQYFSDCGCAGTIKFRARTLDN